MCKQTTVVGIECALPGVSTEFAVVKELLSNPDERQKYMDIGSSYYLP
jgi:hypothetical protein